ncbi:MAG: hypothetical protein RR853_08865 [Aurantimicrobium sp.]|uniref:hypothetical protein n=1 Tax=Aurantimicrobium sp. TaxID=1930784 RepID=UPI002FCBFFB2
MAETIDVGKVCTCIPHIEPHGERILEYEPSCQIHSHHLYDPRSGVWILTQREHQPKIVEGEIEVCDTCTNMNGYPVAWDQTWHALHKDKARQVQHCWRPVEPGSEELVPYCGDESAPRGMGLVTSTEANAVPVCPRCHRMAMAAARKAEWDKVTSEESVNIFKVGWHIGRRLGVGKTRKGLERVRELLGR